MQTTHLIATLLVAHVAVLGYWLGSELVINSTFRYVCWRGDMPFAERSRLLDHVMNADQHVRYAMALQVGLGLALMGLLGYVPGGHVTAIVAAVIAAAWLALVEVTHRARKTPVGAKIARVDRSLRWVAIAVLVAVAAAVAGGVLALPGWLAWKLLAFAGVIGCGLGIRFALIDFFGLWRELAEHGSTDAREQRVRTLYVRATSVLGVLWVLILVITVLSVLRP